MQIHYGFTIKTRDLHLSFSAARKLLIEGKQNQYARAEREGSGFVFRKEYAVCPICAAEIEARELFPAERVVHTEYEISRFMSDQLCFGEPADDVLLLTKATFKGAGSFICPYCSNRLYKTKQMRNIALIREKNALAVRMELKNASELVACVLSVTDGEETDLLRFDAGNYEEVFTLNTATGRAALSLENGKRTLALRDITEAFSAADDILLTMLSGNLTIKTFLLNGLAEFRSTPFFTSPERVTLKELILFNRFKGFDRSFYSGIPFATDSFAPEKSFRAAAEALRDTPSALALLDGSLFSKKKSVKRILFSRQYMLFYVKELEQLYCALNSLDYFVRVIGNPKAELLLCRIHCSPCTLRFVSDCRKYLPKDMSFPELFERFPVETLEYAVAYGSSRREYRSREKLLTTVSELCHNGDSGIAYAPVIPLEAPFSRPMPIKDYSLEDCVRGYTFRYIENTNEARTAGRLLNNCLGQWRVQSRNVILMYKGKTLVAAIELSRDGREYTQARAKNNDCLRSNEQAFSAFQIWRKAHKLKEAEDEWY